MAIQIQIQEVGSNVVVTGTGSLDLSGLSYTSTGTGGLRPAIIPTEASVILSNQLNFTFNTYYIKGMTGPSSFGSGTEVVPNTTSGNFFGISGTGFIAFGDGPQLFVPLGYSGEDLSSTSTYNSATIDSLGLTAGTYTWSWPSDSLTVVIESSAVEVNVSVTQSIVQQPSDITSGTSTTYNISNPLQGSSYFTLETVKNSHGSYDTTSPKNTSGSFTLGSGLSSLVQSDYMASVVVAPGGGVLTFVPATTIVKETLNLRGTGA